jgi:hypothetical protein
MSKDVAQRELDQAGFKISNLGDPTAAGDATKTDNTTVPAANSGTGAAGRSLLAAPADHVHPSAASSSGYSCTLTDPSEQEQSGPNETVIAQFPVDFSPTTPGLIPTFAAIVDVDSGTATFNVRLSITPDVVDGGILATITKAAGSGAELKATVGAAFVPLTQPALIKITAANDNGEASCRIRSKTVTLRAA